MLRVESFLVLPRSCTNRRRKLVHLGISGGVRFLKREKIIVFFTTRNILKNIFFKIFIKKVIFLHVA